MARETFNTELGYGINEENGNVLVKMISGTAIPDGVSGEQGDAPIGSLYIRSGTGQLYQKIANAGAAADWLLNEATTALGNWRPERVDAHTGQVLTAGNTDPTTWSDNDDGTAAAAFTVGHYVLDGNCALWEITGISAPNITLAAAGDPPVADDTFAIKYNMPDPAGQENQAIIVYNGTSCIKVADVDFASATGITITGGYSPVNGTVTSGDSVEGAIEKLDGNQVDLTSSVGVAQGDTNMGTYTGTLLTDNQSAKQNIQELETEAEAVRVIAEGNPETQTGVTTTPTTLSSVNVDAYRSAVWLVTAFNQATPAATKSIIVHAINNGTAAGDANLIDDTVFAKLKEGTNFDFDVQVVLAGSGTGQTMDLQVDSDTVTITATAVLLGTAPSGY